MKLLYSINLKSAENDLIGMSNYPIANYNKSDVLHGIGESYITLIFDYWKQQIVVVQDSLLSFLFNLKGALIGLMNNEKEKANVFSVEQGFVMELTLVKGQVEIRIFDGIYRVGLPEIIKAVNITGNRACQELEHIYKGLNENQHYKKIKKQFTVDSSSTA